MRAPAVATLVAWPRRSARSSGEARRGRRSRTSRSPASRSPPPSRAGSAGSRPLPRASTPTLGLLDADKAERIAAAADRIAAGELDDQFPIDVFQTGSGTVLEHERQRGDRRARRRGRAPERRRQHGPVVERRLPLRRAPRRARRDRRTTCCPRSSSSPTSLEAKAQEFDDVVKSGRTHLMDAVPVTLGQEFAGYAAQVARASPACRTRCRASGRSRSAAPPSGTGLNTHPEFAARVRDCSHDETGLADLGARRPLRGAGRPRRARRDVGRAEDRRRLADEDRERPAPDGLRPARRSGRDLPARAPEGLLDHARQGQPGHPRGRHAGRCAGDRERRRRSRSAACRATSS